MSKEKIYSIVQDLFKPESNTISVAIIEGTKDLVYSTDNWDISGDISNLNKVWSSGNSGHIQISGNNYSILQSTPDRLVAVELGKRKEGIIGFKDEERKIICKLKLEDDDYVGDLARGVTQTSKSLMKLSSKKPYMAHDASLGKEEQREPISLKILSHTTKLMQKIGLEQFGLTSDEAQVYLALLEKGDKGAKVGSINKRLDIKRPTIYKILDKLQENNWLKKVIVSKNSPKLFVARPIDELINTVIKEKEEELKILHSFSLLMGESLEKRSFNLEKLGITGVDKDCGLIIFEFDYNIVDDPELIQSTLGFFAGKMRLEIKKNVDSEDIKIEDVQIQDYLGSIIYLKIEGTEYMEVLTQVAIPIDDKIYIIWGTKEKFPVLLDIIKKL